MTDQRARASAIIAPWCRNVYGCHRVALVEAIASALADERRRALEKVAARIIDTHRMGDRDAWLDLARLIRAKAHAGQEASHD